MPRQILVTGGAGFIGSNIVAELCAAGDSEVAVCDHLRVASTGKWRNLAKHPITDFIAPPDLWTWLTGRGRDVGLIIHMGAVSSTTEPDADKIVHTNFGLSRDIFDWCASHGRRFIYASSAATYGDGAHGFDDCSNMTYLQTLRPLSAYGWSKALFDLYVARRVEAGVTPSQCVGLKFFNVYGPNEGHKGVMSSMVAQMWPRIAAGQAVRLFKSYREDCGDGGQTRDFIYGRDAANIVAWLARNAQISGLFNVGSGVARSFNELASAAFMAADQPSRVDFIEMPLAIRGVYQYHTQASMQRLRTAGYDEAMTNLEDGVGAYVREYLAQADPYR